MNKIIVKRSNIIIYFSLAVLAVVFCLQSTFSPFSVGGMMIDDGVFSYIGKAMTKGFVPYRDMFDHKGPVIFIINWLGHLIAGRTGVWFMEIVNLSVSFIFCYKACNNFARKRYSYFTTIIISILMVQCYTPGNHVEEFAQSFTFVSLYIFTEYFTKSINLSKIKLAVLGFCFACVFMLRPNMIALWIVFCFAISLHLLIKKNFRLLGKFALWFTVGMLILLVPIAIWLLITGSLSECIYQSITFNFVYTGDGSESSSLLDCIKYFSNILINNGNILYILSATYIAVFVKMVIDIKKKDNTKYMKYFFVFSYLAFAILNLLLMVISKRKDPHYFQFYYPAVPIVLAIAFDRIAYYLKKWGIIRKDKVAFVLICSIMLLEISSQIVLWKDHVEKKITERDYTLEKVCETVRENTNQGDLISVYGNNCNIYVETDTYSSSKYIYQVPIGTVDKKICEEYVQDLKENPPVLLVINKMSIFDRPSYDIINKYLEKEIENNYVLVEEIEDTKIYKHN